LTYIPAGINMHVLLPTICNKRHNKSDNNREHTNTFLRRKKGGIEMKNPIADMSQRKAAKVAGLLYLLLIIFGVFAQRMVHK